MNNKNKYFKSVDIFKNEFNGNGNNNNKLNIMSVNVRSISSLNKFNKFKSIVANLPVLPKIIAIQETWFQKNIIQIYAVPGYNAIHCCRIDGYGGTSFYIRDNITYTVELCESVNLIEAIRISVDGILVNGIPLKVTTFYRSPKCNVTTFLSYLENNLCEPCRTGSIILGDSNIDLIDSNSSSDLLSILSCVDYESCHQLISRPMSNTCIDHVYSNLATRLCIDSIESTLSDHNIIWCQMGNVMRKKNEPPQKIKNYNFDNISSEIQIEMDKFDHTDDPSADLEIITSAITKIIKANTTFTTVKGLSRQMLTPWENKHLTSLRIYKEKLLAKRRKRGKDEKTEFILKNISRIIKISSKICMNSYISWNLEKLEQNPRKSWNFLNKCLGRKDKHTIQLTNEANEQVYDDNIKCNIFNDYFLNIPKILKNKIIHTDGDNFNKFCTLTRCASTFSFNIESRNNIMSLIETADNGKSPGHDEISGKILNTSKNYISEHLLLNFNNMLNKCIYPDVLKIAKIVPVPKLPNANKACDFRPIALLSLFDKIFEKLLHKQLSTYLEQTGQVYPMQFGFRKGSGTQDAVVNIVNMICDGLDANFGGVGAVFYDLSKAFDLVDHTILLSKLPYYGISGNALQLIRSYITNRKQFVEINGAKSKTGTVEYGVPQGSVLGPLLFTLYINDISNMNLYGKLVLYADDIALLYPYHHIAILKGQMEQDAAKIMGYCRVKKLVINTNKTKVIRFRPRCPQYDQEFHIQIGDLKIVECQMLKYLGIHMQNNLAWNVHMDELRKKVAPAIGILHKFRNTFNVKTKLLLYNSLIQSHFNYLAMIYAHKNNIYLKSLQRTQNKALKIVFNLSRFYPTTELYKHIAKNILPIHGTYELQVLTYMFKVIHDIGHRSIQFEINQTLVNTRNNSVLRVKRCRLELTKQKIEHNGCLFFNHLPNNIKNITRISFFKKEIKSFLLNNIEMLLT